MEQQIALPDTTSPPDLEQTAELPVLDAGAYAAQHSELGVTDTVVLSAVPALRALEPDEGASLEQHRRLEEDLRSLAENLRELEDRLTHKGERLTEIERELGEAHEARAAAEQRADVLGRDLTDARLALSTARAQSEELTQRLAAREAETRAIRERDRTLESSLGARDRALERAEQQLREVRLQRAAHLEALHRREGRRGVLETMLRALESEAGRRDGQLDRLRAELDAERQRAQALAGELTAAHARIEVLNSEARSRTEAGAQALSAVELRARELEAAGAEQQNRIDGLEAQLAAIRTEHEGALAAARAEQVEALRAVQEELGAGRARVASAEADLGAAEDAIHRLESELRADRARIEELTRLNDDWRATLEAARQSLDERDGLIRRLEAQTAHSTALLDQIQHNVRFLDTAAPGAPGPETATRLLIRSEGDGEVVHVLGRKTSIGRTPDNDVQIDTKFVSRHHAVILAGATHAIIEDLNSTNGVLVNGHAVIRQSLKDGDAITVGKTRFRFAVRPPVERH
ncbi:MAG: FHA domain-containing protein [Steroidobacteraceae bacterium]